MIRVELEYTRGLRKDPGKLARAMRSLPRSIALVLAKEIKRRAKRGDLAGQRVRYESEGQYLVSPRYPVKGSPRQGPSGAHIFDTSAVFHKLQGAKGHDVSGGMWDGLSAVVSAKTATVRFRGRSEGQDPNFRRVGRRTRKQADGSRVVTSKGSVKAKGRKVSNALKAGTVLKQSGISVLALKYRELEDVGLAGVAGLPGGIQAIHDAKIDWQRVSAQATLARKILDEWQRSNR